MTVGLPKEFHGAVEQGGGGGNTAPPAAQPQKNFPMAREQSRNWVFTLNNYTDDDIKDITTWTDRGVEGVGYGKEVGDSGTPHLQGFLVFTKKVSLSTVKDLNGRMHIERMRGKLTQSIAYCSKQDSLTILGKCWAPSAPVAL